MRLLFDHNTPAPLAALLPGHEIARADELGWDTLVNGALIAAAEAAGFDLLVTCDKQWRYQQNLAARTIGILVLPTNRWPHLRAHAGDIAAAVATASPACYLEVNLPRPRLVRRPPPP